MRLGFRFVLFIVVFFISVWRIGGIIKICFLSEWINELGKSRKVWGVKWDVEFEERRGFYGGSMWDISSSDMGGKSFL